MKEETLTALLDIQDRDRLQYILYSCRLDIEAIEKAIDNDCALLKVPDIKTLEGREFELIVAHKLLSLKIQDPKQTLAALVETIIPLIDTKTEFSRRLEETVSKSIIISRDKRVGIFFENVGRPAAIALYRQLQNHTEYKDMNFMIVDTGDVSDNGRYRVLGLNPEAEKVIRVAEILIGDLKSNFFDVVLELLHKANKVINVNQ